VRTRFDAPVISIHADSIEERPAQCSDELVTLIPRRERSLEASGCNRSALATGAAPFGQFGGIYRRFSAPCIWLSLA
jgi:hypothetical protein